MRIAAIVLLLLCGASPAEGQTMRHLARTTAAEAIRDARAHALPPSTPEPRVLIDLTSFQRAFGDRLGPAEVLRGVVGNYGQASIRDAVVCTTPGPGNRRSCAIRGGGLHLQVDSVVQTSTGYDVVVTTTFTEQRRRSSATGHRRVRFSLARDGNGWALVQKAVFRQS